VRVEYLQGCLVDDDGDGDDEGRRGRKGCLICCLRIVLKGFVLVMVSGGGYIDSVPVFW
jgi:hypothetical protein